MAGRDHVKREATGQYLFCSSTQPEARVGDAGTLHFTVERIPNPRNKQERVFAMTFRSDPNMIERVSDDIGETQTGIQASELNPTRDTLRIVGGVPTAIISSLTNVKSADGDRVIDPGVLDQANSLIGEDIPRLESASTTWAGTTKTKIEPLR